MINLALPYDIILRAGSPFVDKEVINISFSHNILYKDVFECLAKKEKNRTMVFIS